MLEYNTQIFNGLYFKYVSCQCTQGCYSSGNSLQKTYCLVILIKPFSMQAARVRNQLTAAILTNVSRKFHLVTPDECCNGTVHYCQNCLICFTYIQSKHLDKDGLQRRVWSGVQITIHSFTHKSDVDYVCTYIHLPWSNDYDRRLLESLISKSVDRGSRVV